jgi:3-methylfumaryl-CoA hydratase
MSSPAEEFSSWVGRTETVPEDISPAKARAAAATFDGTPYAVEPDTALPPLWHWLYFLPTCPQGQLDRDGHPRRTDQSFLPPIPYPRRMFAGARVRWHAPLKIGRPASREGRIEDVQQKSGRSGRLAFVTVRYRIVQDDALCVEEEQDIVYREPGPPLPAPPVVQLPPLPAGTWSRTVTPDSRLLFRFSALTFNAHRIHYDRPYATREEGYPGLVVHGPLTAMLLLDLVRQNTDLPFSAFRFRSQAPLFDLADFRLVGRPSPSGQQIELEAQGPDGKAAMTACAELA